MPINAAVTSKEAILRTCREIVSREGLSALNMRSVAEACHVALGSLYNYFSSKEDLLMATIESVWEDIFHMERQGERDLPFPEYVRWIFERVHSGAAQYPNFFTAHSISFASSAKSRARDTMNAYFDHMLQDMQHALRADGAVRRDLFTQDFTELAFAGFVLNNLLMLLAQGRADCEVLLEVIRRTLYVHP